MWKYGRKGSVRLDQYMQIFRLGNKFLKRNKLFLKLVKANSYDFCVVQYIFKLVEGGGWQKSESNNFGFFWFENRDYYTWY